MKTHICIYTYIAYIKDRRILIFKWLKIAKDYSTVKSKISWRHFVEKFASPHRRINPASKCCRISKRKVLFRSTLAADTLTLDRRKKKSKLKVAWLWKKKGPTKPTPGKGIVAMEGKAGLAWRNNEWWLRTSRIWFIPVPLRMITHAYWTAGGLICSVSQSLHASRRLYRVTPLLQARFCIGNQKWGWVRTHWVAFIESRSREHFNFEEDR